MIHLFLTKLPSFEDRLFLIYDGICKLEVDSVQEAIEIAQAYGHSATFKNLVGPEQDALLAKMRAMPNFNPEPAREKRAKELSAIYDLATSMPHP